MSWFIKQIGIRSKVKEGIEKDTQLPETVKQCILSCLNEELDSLNGVRIEGFGHQYTGKGSYISSIGKLEVEPIDIIL